MPDLDRLTKLFRALATRNWEDVTNRAIEIAAHEEEIGHYHAADLLRGALRPSKQDRRGAEGLAPHSYGEAAGLNQALVRVEAGDLLENVVLHVDARDEIETLLREWTARERLQANGVSRRSRLLFYGPPGCGKTLTARAIGNAAGLPVYVVRFDAVVGAYLGQTALRLREIFRFAELTEAVVVFDEIDALAKRRGSPLDVGELDRVVIALMQELEHTRPRGFVIASSNIPHQLDEALWRRFDLVLPFPAPKSAELGRFASSLARKYGLEGMPASARREAKSFADVWQLVENARRHLILSKSV